MLTAPLSERNHPVARKVTSSTALVLLLGLAACTNPYDPGQRALGGGLIGAGTGAASWRWPRGGDRCRRRRRLGRHHRCTDNASAASLLTPAVAGRASPLHGKGALVKASGPMPGKSAPAIRGFCRESKMPEEFCRSTVALRSQNEP